MPPRRQRMYFIIFSLGCVILAAFLVLNALRDNITLFKTPTDLATKPARIGDQIRIGGMVEGGSVKDLPDGTHEFMITDNKNDLIVRYKGILPSLFREKQGVVAYGAMDVDQTFHAKEILAKHDEKYMPPEVYKEMKQKGAVQ